MQKTVLALILACGLGAAPAHADANAEANRLFVSAVQLWNDLQALTADTEQTVVLLSEIDATLQRIIAEHPASDLAVQLLIGPVGPLSAADIAAAVVDLCDDDNLRLPCALQAAGRITKEPGARWAIPGVALRLARSGDVAGATEVALSAPTAEIRDLGLRLMVAALARAGDPAAAQEVNRQVSTDANQVYGWHSVALARARTGNAAGATDISLAIGYPGIRDDTLRDIAAALVWAGDPVGARSAAQLIESLPRRVQALYSVEMLEAWRRDPAAGLAAVNAMSDPLRRAEVIGDLGTAMGEAGDVQGAAALAALIDGSSSETASILRSIALPLAWAGDAMGAVNALKRIESAPERDRFLTQIAVILASGGATAQARQTVGLIEAAADRPSLLAVIDVMEMVALVPP